MTDDLQTAPETTAEVRRDYQKQKRLILLGLIVVAIISGVLIQLVDENGVGSKVMTLVSGFLSISLLYWWIYYDSIEQNRPVGTVLALCIILVALVGVPIYFFKTRGFHGFVSVGKATLFLSLLILINCGSAYATYYTFRMFAK